VDDGSNDDTRPRLEPYRDRIRYIYQTNQGPSAARNTGVRHARGEWIALLDADDLWHPDKTVMQLRAVHSLRPVALIGSPPAPVLPRKLPERPPLHRITVRNFLHSTHMGPTGALIRREALNAVGGFDEGVCFAEDRDVWLRLAARYPVVLIDTPCWTYRSHPAQSTLPCQGRAAERRYKAYREVLEKFFADHPDCDTLRHVGYSYMCFDAAVCFLGAGQRWRALRSLLQSFAEHVGPLPDPWRPPLFRLRLLLRTLLGARITAWLNHWQKNALSGLFDIIPPRPRAIGSDLLLHAETQENGRG
jgi:hypothetical protein